MPNTPEKSIGEQNYEQFAHRYAQLAPTKPHNAYYERPATMSLIPDVDGKHVLDAGCGPGDYAERLIERGAHVVAFDVTPDFVEITRQKVGDKATVLRADLNHPLDFADDATFDLVICPLVLDYIEHWDSVFQEFFRVLKPNGILIFSGGHPLFDVQFVPDGIYFDIELFEGQWRGFGKPYPLIKAYRRPLSAALNPLVKAGFILDEILEPIPTQKFKDNDPESYAYHTKKPAFWCIKSHKPA